MPLVKIFSRQPLRVATSTLHRSLAQIWGVAATPDVMKVLSLPMHDASNSGEEVYVDVRAKAKPDRTPQVAQECCNMTADLLRKQGYNTQVRLELYEPSLQYTARAHKPTPVIAYRAEVGTPSLHCTSS
eukprot:gb/GFBE01064016.1/.p1 GENE.gb/GFBE01064016.1/~~gb/GFBE01064016.1/.p1  ORF type:complete len:129 (+),score=20.27 gb/GFBE01064016.1/:1-387(+)